MEYDDAELDRLSLLEACMRIGLAGSPVRELELDPARALAIIEYAERQQALKSIAGFAIARYRSGFDPRSTAFADVGPRSRAQATREPEPVEAPPTLSAIEYLWSRTPSPMLESVARMMGVAIGRSEAGLEGVLRDGWWSRERYDDGGELIASDRG